MILDNRHQRTEPKRRPTRSARPHPLPRPVRPAHLVPPVGTPKVHEIIIGGPSSERKPLTAVVESGLGFSDDERRPTPPSAPSEPVEPAVPKGKPGRRGYPQEALAYAQKLRLENPSLKAHTLRRKCLLRFHPDQLPGGVANFRRWLNRHREK